MTSSKVEWRWGDEEERAFEEIKDRLTRLPVLAQPDSAAAMSGERPFLLTTDASKEGVGAVLAQKGEDGRIRPIAFYSRATKQAEQNYSITDLEALGVYSAVSNFRHLLYGVKFVLYTDHQPLVSLFRRMNVSPRVLRWVQELMIYQMDIKYLAGSQNVVADALSRQWRAEESGERERGEELDIVLNRLELKGAVCMAMRKAVSEEGDEMVGVSKENRKRWSEEVAKDEFASEIMQKLSERKSDETERICVPGAKKRTTLADWEKSDDGVLMLIGPREQRLVYVPTTLRREVVKDAHESSASAHMSAHTDIHSHCVPDLAGPCLRVASVVPRLLAAVEESSSFVG